MYLLTFIIGTLVGFFLAALITSAAETPHEATLDNGTGIPPWMPTWEQSPPLNIQLYTYDQLVPPDGVSHEVGPLSIVQEEEGVLMVQIPTDVAWITPGDKILLNRKAPASLMPIRGKSQ